MAIKTYTQSEMLKQISEHYTVRDLWLDTAKTSIRVDETLLDLSV